MNVTDFVSLVRETPRGASQSFDWLPKNKGEDQRFGLTISAILRGAEAALAEMLARLPAAKGGAFDRWHVAASRLAAILIQFDLIEAIDRNIDHRTRAACENFAQAMDANFGISAHPAELRAYPFYCIAMMICGIYPGYRWPDYPVWTHSLTSVGEPLEDLACLPISAKHAGAIGAPDPSAASIADLFCSVLASPQRIYNMPDIEDIFWFGAARVVGCDPPSISSYSPRRRIDLVHDSRLRRLTIAARLWVRKELPSRCFSPTVEKLIEDNPSAP
ncbi:hypothetical protein [uncultured Bradyrhizobium sp.]|uniref:hypothetical protein n=1 Tax=uncultured Bradyrhizobium sp. TaxID=199684 RepID=UPI00261990A2|nr:hypothetical protein [uncultured Bradyrhizobium sp.]